MRFKRLAIPHLMVACCGCNLLVPEGGYLRNRLDDLTEAAHVDLASSFAFGALANVGPALLGFHQLAGLEYGERLQLGLGGVVPLRTANDSVAAGLGVPLAWARPETDRGEPLSGYRSRHPGYGSLGVDLGLLVGFGARVDLVELADFLAGIFGADLLGDDAIRPDPMDVDGGRGTQEEQRTQKEQGP